MIQPRGREGLKHGRTGQAALRLWDLTVGWSEFPHLYEIRRPKTPADLAHIDA
jgi:hypothetical protein